MDKILFLEETSTNRIVEIKYKTNIKAKVTIFTLLIDLVSLILFDWWVWLPIWIFTTLFRIEKYREVDSITNDVYDLLTNGFQPIDYENAHKIITDFNLPAEVIEDDNFRQQIITQATLRRVS